MLKQGIKSEQPSKNVSFNQLGLPQLSHKPSEKMHQERVIDFSLLPHWNDALSVTDCSSAGRFFRNSEAPKTARATSHPSKIPKFFLGRESHASKIAENLNPDNSFIWEILERIDTCKIRTEINKNSIKTYESISSQISNWTKCCSEVSTIIKSLNSDLSHSLTLAFNEIFSLFEDYSSVFKETECTYKTTISELSLCIKSLKNNVSFLQKQNSDLVQTLKFDEFKIKKEVDDMFPDNQEEILRLKEESLMLRNKKYNQLPQALEKLYNDMNKELPIPEATDLDFNDINADEITNGLMDKYKIIVTTTVKNLKKTMSKKHLALNMAAQTEAAYVDPKIHEEMTRQLDKTTLAYQSAMMQLGNHKEDSSNKSQLFEKYDQERNQYISENLQLKRDIEFLNRDIQSLKYDIEQKKIEISKLKQQNDGKIEQIVDLENKIDVMTEKNLDLSYELEKYKRSRPPSAIPANKDVVNYGIKDEPKKNRLDDVTKTGFTVREELERSYQSNLAAMRKKPQEASMKKLDSESARLSEKNDRKAVEKTIEKVVEKSLEKALDRSIEKSIEKSVEKSKEKSLEKTVEKAAERNYVKEKALNVSESNEKVKNVKLNMKKTKDIESVIVMQVPDTPDYTENSSITITEPHDENKAKNRKTSNKRSVKSKPNIVQSNTSEVPKSNMKKMQSTAKIESPTKSEEKKITKPAENIIKKTPKLVKSTDRHSRPKEKVINSSNSTNNSTEKLSKTTSFSLEKSKKPRNAISQDYSKPKMKTQNTATTKETKEYSQKDPSSEENSHIVSVSKYYNQDEIIEQSIESSPFASFVRDKSSSPVRITVFPVNSRNSPIKKIESVASYEEKLDQQEKLDKTIEKCPMCDKICGKDFVSEVSVGIQVDTSKPFKDDFVENQSSYFLPYNPNKVYGLRGDVFYKGSTFQPQARIPDLNDSLLFTPAYKLANTNV